MGNVKLTEKENATLTTYFDLNNKKFPQYADSNKWIKKHFFCFNHKYTIPAITCNKLIRRDFIVDNNLRFKEHIVYQDELFMFYAVQRLKSMAFTSTYTYIYHLYGNSQQTTEGNRYDTAHSWYIILKDVFPSISKPYAKRARMKYIVAMFSQMQYIDLSKNTLLYGKYRALAKKISLNELFHLNLNLFFALSLLLLPQSVIKINFVNKIFNLCLRMSFVRHF